MEAHGRELYEAAQRLDLEGIAEGREDLSISLADYPEAS
jgi:hypothetical protein